MSLLIKNMKMPTGCASCDFWRLLESDNTPYCQRTMHMIRKMAERPEWCPILLELPEDHGPLIDVTKIDFVMFTNEDSTYRCGWNNGVRSVMQHADTVIPAERSTK